MVGKRIFTGLLSLTLWFGIAGAQSSWHKVSDLPGKPMAVEADGMGNIYYFDSKYQFIKTDSSQKILSTYSNYLLGQYSQIIPGNSFRTYILLKDYNQLLVLDKRLQLVSTLELNQLGFITVTMVAPSDDNRSLWIFDRVKGEVVAIDDKKNFIRTTGPLEQYYSLPVMPDRMLEKAGKLYLFYEKIGVAIFDDQGSYESFITFPGATSLTVSGDKIIYVSEAKNMEVYDLRTFFTSIVETPYPLRSLVTGWQYFLLQGEDGAWSVFRTN